MSSASSCAADLVSGGEHRRTCLKFLQYLQPGCGYAGTCWTSLQSPSLALCRHASRLCDHQEWLSLSGGGCSSAPSCAWPTAWLRELEAEGDRRALHLSPWRAGLPSQLPGGAIRSGVIDGQICCRPTVKKVGQINGLSVIPGGVIPYDFGEPVRLTATVHLGWRRGRHRAQARLATFM